MSATPRDGVPPNPRRVVTGHDENGKAVLSMDGLAESKDILPGIRSSRIWTTDSTPSRDNNSGVDGATRPVPGMGLIVPNGTNYIFTDLAPDTTCPVHRTNSVDYNILISGRLVLVVDDGVRTEMHPGDVVVQRGTAHTWHNPSKTEWARLASVIIDAEPAKVNGEELEEVWKP